MKTGKEDSTVKKPVKKCRPVPGLSREDEEKQLQEIICAAQENLERTQAYIRSLSDNLEDLREVYGAKDKEALALFYNTQSQLAQNQRGLLRCQKARKKPYFGRIDFKDPKQPQAESYYIGRCGISRNGEEPLVIDWRAPLASVYYENAIGPCRYVVRSEGACEIDLQRKRTYEIEEDRLRDFYDSDVVANDELLTQYLAKNKKAVLGEIISTIQKEQNEIIRRSPRTNLIVQGVAGSGKTTVAMHRISYILYNYEEMFRPQDFYIIGSSRILLDYITGVLPDLDVYGVLQMTMEQLFTRLLYEDWDSGLFEIRPVDRNEADACIKGSYAWFLDLEQFCVQLEQETVACRDVYLEKNGTLLLPESEIRSFIKENSQLSMQSKINQLNEMLLARLENELSGKNVSYPPAEKKELKRAYRWHFGKEEWKGSVFEVYAQFLEAQKQAGKAVSQQERAYDVYDLAALAYIYKRIKETDGIREASHVIIDEAQDFGMMAYGALAYCLRGCTYTIMGDVSQNIHFGHGLNDWRGLQKLILKGTYDHFGVLKKSYRNTVEISRFAEKILRHGSFAVYPAEPVIRHGNAVQVCACSGMDEMSDKMACLIADWLRLGRETFAVICRDEVQAGKVQESLGKRLLETKGDFAGGVQEQLQSLGTQMLSEKGSFEKAEFGSGVLVLPAAYAKGLEFDAVLIYDASREHYPAEDAYVKLLYVAATRALHELAVVYCGALTDLIGQPVTEQKRMQSLDSGEWKEAKRYRKTELTQRQEQLQKIREGDIERAGRSSMGPRPVAVRPAAVRQVQPEPARRAKSCLQNPFQPAAAAGNTRNKQDASPVNPSPYRFGECPDNSLLRPAGHGYMNNAVRIAKKEGTYVECISSCGTLRITPINDSIIRVQFGRVGMQPQPGYWHREPEGCGFWKARQGNTRVEIDTGTLVARIEKKTGAVQFLDRQGRLLLAEHAALPRQIQDGDDAQAWVYFDWPKQEQLSAKGLLADELERINKKARYISFGGRKMRMPLLVSSSGYGLGIASESTVMCCMVPSYGNYVYTQGSAWIDYYFLYGGDEKTVLKMYASIRD